MNWNRVYSLVKNILWATLALLLPFTSLPLVSKLARGTMVAPASLLPLGLLIFIWFLPYILCGGRLPREALVLLAFASVALFSSLLAFFIPIPAFRGTHFEKEILESLITLGIGMAFYFISSAWLQNEKNLSMFLRWVNWGGLAILLWSLTQALFWKMNLHWPEWIRSLQELFSVGTLYAYRVTGFALEPSWLANQLNTLYLPLWLASSLTNHTVHRRRLGWVTFEKVFLVGGVALLLLTNARIGLLAFLLVAAFVVFDFSLKFAHWLRTLAQKRWKKIALTLGLYLMLASLGAGIAFGLGYRLSKSDPRMRNLFDFETLRTKSFLDYAKMLSFASRMVYWQTGWETFEQHPFLGVGLGNAGYYFPQNLSPYSWGLPEVRDYLYRSASPPNIKALWVRLLAETGWVGFAFWLVFYILLGILAFALQKSSLPLLRMIGKMGIFTLIAFLIEGFSIDSFALPYFWIAAGIVSGAFTISVGEKAVDEKNHVATARRTITDGD